MGYQTQNTTYRVINEKVLRRADLDNQRKSIYFLSVMHQEKRFEIYLNPRNIKAVQLTANAKMVNFSSFDVIFRVHLAYR